MITDEPKNTMLWLTGWSMPNDVFELLQRNLPEFRHISVSYNEADTPESMIVMVKAAVREKREKGSLLIAGWSLGALIGLSLASEVSTDGVVILGGTACFVRPKEEVDRGWPYAYVRQMMAAIRRNRDETLRQFHRSIFTEAEWLSGPAQRFPANTGWTTPALIAGLQLLCDKDIRSRLKDIPCPVLMLHGSLDKVIPYKAAEEMKKLLQQADLIKIDEGGHVPFLGRERQTAETIRRWWNEQKVGSNSGAI